MTSTLRPLCLGSPRFPPDIHAAGRDDAQRWSLLLARFGPEKAASQVKGDFAVALPSEDGSVFMAVDRFAIRTLCYSQTPDGLHFGERADRIPSAIAGLDSQALYDYFYFHVIPAPRTAFKGVSRLPAAHFASYRNGQLTVAQYWVPEFSPVDRPSFGELREEFLGLLRNAVQVQLDDTPGACFLSGGTDSSTVAGMIGLASGMPAICYSVGFKADGYDEMAFARLAARHFGCEHRELYVTPEDLLRDIPNVAAWYDQPFGNSSALPSYLCAKRARADGVTRLLAGDGGDELFGGNSRYASQQVFDHYKRVPAVIRRGLLEPFFNLRSVSSTPVLRKGSNYIRLANTPLPDRGQDYNLLRRVGDACLLTPSFLAMTEASTVEAQQRSVWRQARCSDELNRHLAFDWRYTLAECDLPKVVGTTTMAGLGVGFPMLDDALLKFSMTLPADYKVRGKVLRWFFKESLRGFLPLDVITKQKQGFGLPFGVWMVRHPGLRQMVNECAGSLVSRGFLRADFGRLFFDELLPQHPHYYGTLGWLLIMFEHWLRQHAPNWKVEIDG